MELQSIIKLISGHAGEIPPSPSADSLSPEFSSVLFALMTPLGGDSDQPLEDLDASSILLSSKEFFPPSEKTEYPLNTFPSLFVMDMISPLLSPITSESGWANPSHQPPHEISPFPSAITHPQWNICEGVQQEPSFSPEKLENVEGFLVQNDLYRIEKPFISTTEIPRDDRFWVPGRQPMSPEGVERKLTDPSSFQFQDKENIIPPSLPTGTASEYDQTLFTRDKIFSEASLNPFQIKKEPVAILSEGHQGLSQEQRFSPSQKTHPHPMGLKELNQPFLVGSMDETPIAKAGHGPESNPLEVIFHKNSSPYETQFLPKEGAAILSKELSPLEGRLDTPPSSSSKVEVLPLNQQIGPALLKVVRNGEERIRIRLDPPELGTLYIKISKEQDVLKATVWAEHPATKALLETHQQELRNLLEGDGFKLEKFEVFVQQEFDLLTEKREFAFFKDGKTMHGFGDESRFCSSEPSPLSSPGVCEFLGLSQYINKIV